MVVFLEVPIIPTNAPPVPGLVLSIPFLTKGMQGGIMVLVGRRVFPEKNLDELSPGDDGGDKADAGMTRLEEDCFHIFKGERENC
jgi:hypothetical protein